MEAVLRANQCAGSKLKAVLASIAPASAPPAHLYTDATIERLRRRVRTVFTSAEPRTTRPYLEQLLAEVKVMGEKVTLTVNNNAAARLLASGGENEPERSGEPPVLASGYGKLPFVDEFRTAVMKMWRAA